MAMIRVSSENSAAVDQRRDRISQTVASNGCFRDEGTERDKIYCNEKEGNDCVTWLLRFHFVSISWLDDSYITRNK